MFNLYAVNAREGDCFILEFGIRASRYILVDGGPKDTFYDHLEPVLRNLLKKPRKLNTIIISHVDNDHIIGIVDLLSEIEFELSKPQPNPFVTVDQIWINSFKHTFEKGNFENRIKVINAAAGALGIKSQEMNLAFNGIKEGSKLIATSRQLDIPLNPNTREGIYKACIPPQIITKDNLKITILGPTRSNLEKLQQKWEDWLQKNEMAVQDGNYTKEFAAMQDRSIPNLSSLIFLVEAEGNSILFTGDCRGDHLQDGLIETELSSDGRFHVDILKVPHHGSRRNVSKQFFQEVTADVYVISANGKYGNPDYETLSWIVETAKESGRRITLVYTNITASIERLKRDYPGKDWEYTTRCMPQNAHSIQVL